jgi:DNA-binding beta-propeller fold protein YncE
MQSAARVLALFLLVACTGPVSAAKIVLVAGGDKDAVGIPATEAKLREPFGTEFDANGNMFIVEMVSGNRLLKVDTQGILTHIAGTGKAGDGGDGGPALQAQFNGPHNLAVLPNGDVLIGDTWNGRVRKVDMKSGLVTSLPGYNVPPDKARGAGPYCIALNPDGSRLYIADLRRIHMIDLKTGHAQVVAGNGQKGIPPDLASATDSPLADPRAVAVDRRGKVYILERNGNALRVVEPGGKIRTLVNARGAKGNSGDGGNPLEATMNGPKHICVDKEDNVIIADAENHVIRKFDTRANKLVRIAGTGARGGSGVGGDPLKCELNRPHGVTVHPKTGELYITDSYNNRVLKIVP